MINSKPKKKVLKKKNPKSEYSKWKEWAVKELYFSEDLNDSQLRTEITKYISSLEKKVTKLTEELQNLDYVNSLRKK